MFIGNDDKTLSLTANLKPVVWKIWFLNPPQSLVRMKSFWTSVTAASNDMALNLK